MSFKNEAMKALDITFTVRTTDLGESMLPPPQYGKEAQAAGFLLGPSTAKGERELVNLRAQQLTEHWGEPPWEH